MQRLTFSALAALILLATAYGTAQAQSQIRLPLLAYTPPDCTSVVRACNLTDTLDPEIAPTWSPDGHQIAYVRLISTAEGEPDSGIYVVNSEGGKPVRLSDVDSIPKWSPDGTKIAYTQGDLYVMNADGSQVTEVGNGTSRAQAVVWSPDGSKIAFQSFTTVDDCCDFAGALYVINADGSHLTKLADDVALSPPSWSPDSQKIVASIYSTGTMGSTDVYVIEADGSHATNLTNDTLYNMAALWSPDGRKIAFVSQDDSFGRILTVMNADGSSRFDFSDRIMRFDVFDAPVWSPDSSKLLYLTSRPSDPKLFGIYVVDATAAQGRRLIYSAEGFIWSQPAWSPNGSKIAFSDGQDIFVLGIK